MKQEELPIFGFISEVAGRNRSKQSTMNVSEAARPQAKIEKRTNLERGGPVSPSLVEQNVLQRSRQRTVIQPNMEMLTK